MKLSILAPLTLLFAATGTTALFDCNKDQHGIVPKIGKFFVHYSGKQDSDYDGNKPWIRICIPTPGKGWHSINPIPVGCDGGDKSWDKGLTGLKDLLSIKHPRGCDDGKGDYDDGKGDYDDGKDDYDDGWIKYGDQEHHWKGDDKCSKKTKGYACEFDY